MIELVDLYDCFACQTVLERREVAMWANDDTEALCVDCADNLLGAVERMEAGD